MTTYDQLGGHDPLKVAISVFYNRVTKDPVLAPYFDGVDLAKLRKHQQAFLTAALGGPSVFVGRPLGAAHQAYGITNEAFDVMIEHLELAMLDVGIQPEVVAIAVDGLRPLRASVVTEG